MYGLANDPRVLTDFAFEFLETQGASKVGVATVETLAGGPPSTDLEYVLPGAKSAVSFAVPFDEDAIDRYLSKQSHGDHQTRQLPHEFLRDRPGSGPGGVLKPAGDPLCWSDRQRGLPQGDTPRHLRLHARPFAPLRRRGRRRREVRHLGQCHDGRARCLRGVGHGSDNCAELVPSDPLPDPTSSDCDTVSVLLCRAAHQD